MIDNWTVHGPTLDCAQVFLSSDPNFHPIRLEYFEDIGDATIRLLWRYPFAGSALAPIPMQYLYPLPADACPADGAALLAQTEDVCPEPTPTATPTPTCILPNCAVNGNDAIPAPTTWSSEQGVYVAALNTTVYGDGTCNGLATTEDRLDCADDVYDAYYNGFGDTPTLVNLLAAIFDEELGPAVSGGQEVAVEAFANNYLAACSEGCTKAELVWWLASKQGWYGYAGLPLTNLINATNQSNYSPTAASRVFSETWTGGYGDGNVPYDWDNWAYGTIGYTSIRGGTQTVEYYRIWQAWFDYHSYSVPNQADQRARCDNGFDMSNNRVPSDFWTDYLFAIVTFNQDLALPYCQYVSCLSQLSIQFTSNELASGFGGGSSIIELSTGDLQPSCLALDQILRRSK